MKSSLVLSIASVVCIGVSAAYAAAPAAPPTLHDLMKNVVAVQAQVVWDVGNNAVDDQGNPDASKLKAAEWTRIASAAAQTKQVADTLAKADHVLVAAPGQKLDGEADPGAFTAKQVQGFLDADPKTFRAFAQALSGSMEQVAAAARAKDAAKLADVSGTLDEVCESCHMQFWYPKQKGTR